MSVTIRRRSVLSRFKWVILAAIVLAVVGVRLWAPYQSYLLVREIERLGGTADESDPNHDVPILLRPWFGKHGEVEVQVSLTDAQVDDEWIRDHKALRNFHNLSLRIDGTRLGVASQ